MVPLPDRRGSAPGYCLPMIEDFNGRVAVVTGGASGIGKAIAAASKAAGILASAEVAYVNGETLMVEGGASVYMPSTRNEAARRP
jgi:succinate dehydrogenase/fumarate reductase flavoprotein subunit